MLCRLRWGFRKDLGLFTDGPAILAFGYCDYRFIPRIVSSRSQPLGKCRRGDNARDTEAIECEQISLISGDQPISPPCRSEEYTSELQSLMRISYAVFCLKKKNKKQTKQITQRTEQKHQTQRKKHYNN